MGVVVAGQVVQTAAVFSRQFPGLLPVSTPIARIQGLLNASTHKCRDAASLTHRLDANPREILFGQLDLRSNHDDILVTTCWHVNLARTASFTLIQISLLDVGKLR